MNFSSTKAPFAYYTARGWGQKRSAREEDVAGEELQFGGGAWNRKNGGKPPHPKKSGEKRQIVD